MELLLAVAIADSVQDAISRRRDFDIETEASDLLARHPEARVSAEDIAAAMQDEMHRRPPYGRGAEMPPGQAPVA